MVCLFGVTEPKFRKKYGLLFCQKTATLDCDLVRSGSRDGELGVQRGDVKRRAVTTSGTWCPWSEDSDDDDRAVSTSNSASGSRHQFCATAATDDDATTRFFIGGTRHLWNFWVKGKGSRYSITERRVPELIPVLGSQPAGDVCHKPGGRLPDYFPPSLQLPPQPLRGLLPVLLFGEQRHDGCEQFA